MISDLFRTDDTDKWIEKLLAAKVSCAPINTVEQALTADHTIARELVTEAEHSTEGTIKLPGIPFRFSDTAATIRRAPPTLGEHTNEVLTALGKSEDEIAALRDAGAI
jgi:crotonobetainyl-CoA:carnitine CoA-transferase CaiB-like acyl-CoA transferase